METQPPPQGPPSGDDEAARRLRGLSRRGFATAGAAALAGLGAWRWLATRSADAGIPWPLRRVLRLNERAAKATFRPGHLAPEFPPAGAVSPRVNGLLGMTGPGGALLPIDPDAWRLRVVGEAGAKELTLAEIRALPRFEMTTELKCIEGWSAVVRWAGARLSDLAETTGLAVRGGGPGLLAYASLATPDGAYYVGLDMASALHPQALLCYEMGGLPLAPSHGAPLRLAIPLKYGIKNLKRIGTIRFTDARPPDYWAELGYDWHAGH